MACLVGGKLKLVGIDVTLYNRLNPHVERIQHKGLNIIDKNSTSVTVPLTILQELKGDENFDIVLVLLKTHVNHLVLSKMNKKIPTETLIITMQNGIGNVEMLKDIFPNHEIIGGTLGCGASISENGTIIHGAWGKNYLGASENITKKKILNKFAAALDTAGLDTTIIDDLQSLIWKKLLVNISFNALTALTRLKNGTVLNTAEGRTTIENIVKEAITVARALNIEMDEKSEISEILRIGQEEIGDNKSSMLMDILLQRSTEVDVINGAISKLGRELKISTPYNDLITDLIKIIESNYPNQVKRN